MKEQLDELNKELRARRTNPNPAPNLISAILIELMLLPPQPTVEQLRHAVHNLERQMEILEYNRCLIVTGTEMSLVNALINIENLQLDKRLIEENITLSEESLRRIGIRRQFGQASENDYRLAEQALTQNRTNMDVLSAMVSNEKRNLNRLLQLSPEEEIIVVWERDDIELPEDIDEFIQVQLEDAPTIKQKILNVEIKKANMDINRDDARKLSLQNEYDQALRELNGAKISLEAAIVQNGQNIEQLIQREASLWVDVEKAADQYFIVETHVNAGTVTAFELEHVSLATLHAETAIIKNQNQLWLLHFIFMHPYLIA
jgi:outer membrane protein TolC